MSSRAQLGKCSSGTNRLSQYQLPSSTSASRHRGPSSPRTHSPSPPRVVTPRGVTSTSTSSLNCPPSYSSNAIRRSSIGHHSLPTALPRALSPSTLSHPRSLSPGPHHHPQQQHQHVVSPSSATPRHTNASTSSLICRPFKYQAPSGDARPLRCTARGYRDPVEARALGYVG